MRRAPLAAGPRTRRLVEEKWRKAALAKPQLRQANDRGMWLLASARMNLSNR